MPIITALHLRETMSKFRSKRTFRSSPRKESIMACSLFLGYFEFDNSLFVKLNCSLVDLSSRLEETRDTASTVAETSLMSVEMQQTDTSQITISEEFQRQ